MEYYLTQGNLIRAKVVGDITHHGAFIYLNYF